MEPIHCPEDSDSSIYCNLCDILCIDKYYQNHLKSQTHLNNLRKKNSTIIRFIYFNSKFFRYIYE